jgi:acyl-coenzyme A synthetase/AMP-(fatty) acid ligase
MNFFNELERYAGNTALVTERGLISYGELLDASQEISRDVESRSLIFAVCKNNYESVTGYIGFMRAGAAVALINDTFDTGLFERLLDAYRPGYIYLPEGKASLNIGYKTVRSHGGYKLMRAEAACDYMLHDDLGLLMTTSGSTGSPKLVRQSYKNIRSNAEAIAQYLEITASDRSITTMPMSYTYGLSIINSHLFKGASVILTEATLMEKRFWDAIRGGMATTFGGVPYIYEILKKLRFDRMDIPSLRYITQAGGRLTPGLSFEFADICRKKGIRFFTMYGQTEATARMSYLPWEHSRQKAGSIGIAIPGGRFWLKDESGNIIQENDTPGELVYEGENVTLGYAENCLDLSKGDENRGVLHTGDIARRDADGFYYIVGRKKRFLKMFGSRVNLDEVEEIAKLAGFECVCGGCDDDMKIFVTARSDMDRIGDYISGRTGINRSAVTVVHIDKIPRNESKKVIYSALG